MRIQAIYLDGRVWEGSTDLSESRAHGTVRCAREL
jgi:hypothetical protein